MKRITILLGLLLIAAATALPAQVFLISTSPRSITVTGPSATFSITVTAQVGFKSSVFISASMPTLPQATVAVTPAQINAPYTDTAQLTVTLTGPKTGGTHPIYITAKNGPTLLYDTVSITIPNRSNWHVYDSSNTPYDVRYSLGQLDRRRGTMHFIYMPYNSNEFYGDSIVSFDKTTWSIAHGPSSATNDSLVMTSLAIDAYGDLWAAGGGFIAHKHGTTWSVYDGSDSTNGPSGTSLAAAKRGPTMTNNNLLAGPDSTIWLQGPRGVLRYDQPANAWHTYTPKNSDMPPVNFNTSMLDRSGNLWLFGDETASFDKTYWSVYDKLNVTPLAFDFENRLVAVDNYYGSIFDPVTGQLTHLPDTLFTTGQCALYDHDSTLYTDTTIWIGTSHGLWRYQGTIWWHYTIGNSGLPDDNILSIDVDDFHTVWVRTGKGLVTFDKTIDPALLFVFPTSSVAEAGSGAASRGITIVPNPARDRALVRLNIAGREHFRVSLMDQLGREVKIVADRDLDESSNLLDVDLSGLQAGLYFVRAVGERRSLAQSIIVAR